MIKVDHVEPLHENEDESFKEIGEFAHVINPTALSDLKVNKMVKTKLELSTRRSFHPIRNARRGKVHWLATVAVVVEPSVGCNSVEHVDADAQVENVVKKLK